MATSTTHTMSPNKREPVSLAVAADVSQVQINPENESTSHRHAMGDAVAQRLKSLLSHVDHPPSNATSTLASSKPTPCTIPGNAPSSTVMQNVNSNSKKTLSNNFAPASQEKVSDITNSTSSEALLGASPPTALHSTIPVSTISNSQHTQTHPQEKEFIFKRMIHAVDNYFHPHSSLADETEQSHDVNHDSNGNHQMNQQIEQSQSQPQQGQTPQLPPQFQLHLPPNPQQIQHHHRKPSLFEQIQNTLHPQHHHQGHNWNSGHESSSSFGLSTHSCSVHCFNKCPPQCSYRYDAQNLQQQQPPKLKQQQQRQDLITQNVDNQSKHQIQTEQQETKHPQQTTNQNQMPLQKDQQQQKIIQQHAMQQNKDPKEINDNEPSNPHHLSRFSSFASSITSAFASHSQTQPHSSSSVTQTQHSQQTQHSHTKSLFSFPFHLHKSEPAPKSTIHVPKPRIHYKGPLLHGTYTYEQHEAKIMAICHICDLYKSGYDFNDFSRNSSRRGRQSNQLQEVRELQIDDGSGHVSSVSGDNENDGENINKSVSMLDVCDKESAKTENIPNDEKESIHSGNSTGSSHFERRARDCLASIGFEFRWTICEECRAEKGNEEKPAEKGLSHLESGESCSESLNSDGFRVLEQNHQEENAKKDADGNFRDGSCEENQPTSPDYVHPCPKCVTRLYHTPSNKLITPKNRKEFIADGKMYEAVSDLCQAAAHEIMAETCNLVWVTVCDGKGGGLYAKHRRWHSLQNQKKQLARTNSTVSAEWPRDKFGNIVLREPIRALVGRHQCDEHGTHDPNSSHHLHTPEDTFLVATGKGKVRAGIFSRQHLMTTGLEPSTALPLLREARSRGMNCVVIDPNARGDREGMETFEASIRSLFERNAEGSENISAEQDDDEVGEVRDSKGGAGRREAIIPSDVDGAIYVLAHSAAGGQLVRYLLDQEIGSPLLSRIRSISFTDSTHSIQWAKNQPHLSSLLQSSKVLYVKTPNPTHDNDWEDASPGDECPKDNFWTHRFGKVRTVWAGTADHSLANWAAKSPIWQHFDSNREINDSVDASGSSKVVLEDYNHIGEIKTLAQHSNDNNGGVLGATVREVDKRRNGAPVGTSAIII